MIPKIESVQYNRACDCGGSPLCSPIPGTVMLVVVDGRRYLALRTAEPITLEQAVAAAWDIVRRVGFLQDVTITASGGDA